MADKAMVRHAHTTHAAVRAACPRVTLRRYISLLATYARMDYRWLMQDTLNCILTVFSDIISNIASISGVLLLAIRFGGVGGLTMHETLFMLGYATMVDGLFMLFFCGCNAGHISRRIGRSQVDHMLIQPLPLPIQVLTEGFLPVSANGMFFSGVAVTAYALFNIEISISFGWICALAVLLFTSLAIMFGMSYTLGSSAFYRPVSCEEVSSVALDSLNALKKFPLGGLPIVLQGALLTLLPAGLLGWFPSLLLLGKEALLPGLLLPLGMATFLVSVAALAFSRGLKHYFKVGSARYKAVGHRS